MRAHFTATLFPLRHMSSAQLAACGQYQVTVESDETGSPNPETVAVEILARLIGDLSPDEPWPWKAIFEVRDANGKLLPIHEDQCPTDVGAITYRHIEEVNS